MVRQALERDREQRFRDAVELHRRPREGREGGVEQGGDPRGGDAARTPRRRSGRRWRAPGASAARASCRAPSGSTCWRRSSAPPSESGELARPRACGGRRHRRPARRGAADGGADRGGQPALARARSDEGAARRGYCYGRRLAGRRERTGCRAGARPARLRPPARRQARCSAAVPTSPPPAAAAWRRRRRGRAGSRPAAAHRRGREGAAALLERKQLPLARLALETLLELAPGTPTAATTRAG